MILWLDAQFSPYLASWITETLGIEARAVRDVGLRDARDRDIYMAARDLGAVVVTKDRDFLDLLEQHGPPPQVIWVTCGNSSNAYLRAVFERTLPAALVLLGQGEPFIEISDAI